ncbi:thioredoxin domain-containing protein [Streptomyces orinoci]|uniref:Thioredoxin domain-containing protein n=1 Tax=Streptomyces orinoci TaxID=67339 RepID=A0ABV3JX99_STRON|nr:thioredoxin domain-containing protein [Streptomyces orinoci]
MSKQNSDGKRSARERLQEQRLRDESRDRRKRTLIAAGAVIAVLGAGTGVAVLVAGSKDKGHNTPVAGPPVAPQGTQGKDHAAIPVGKAAAAATLVVYEDFRCPACGLFENAYRSTIHSLEDEGKLKAEYHIVTLIDKNLGGKGSVNAANAAACAQDAGKFSAYHDVLYQNQPVETDDAFAAKSRLVQLADKVQGLNTPVFQKCVDEGTHDSWVQRNQAAFAKSGYKATPTVLLNGKSIYADPAHPLTPAKLRQMAAAAGAAKRTPAAEGED